MGGGTRVLVIYAQKLMRMGHAVLFVSPAPEKPSPKDKMKSWLIGHVSRSGSEATSYLDGSGVNHKVLDRFRPVVESDLPDSDVVIATWWETAEWVSALSPEKGSKVYFIQHHEVFPYLPVERCRATYRLPLHKVVVAEWLRRIMSSEYGDNHVDLVPNSVDHSQFFAAIRGKQSMPTAGFLYSSVPFKGVDLTLDAIRRVRQRVPNLRIVSFGSENEIGTLKLPPGTNFHRRPPQDKIRDVYCKCDVWVTASRSEGFNLPAMEAMACRTPVVSTRTGWPEEAIKTGHNGVLVNVADTEALAQGIEWVLSLGDHDWLNLSSNAYDTVASSSWDASASLFEKALISARRRHPIPAKEASSK
jgi:glycosyltransferase involved in cell wall biosynthesis